MSFLAIFEREQKAVEIGKIKIGGQPGENSTALVGTVFYKSHLALLNEKTGEIDRNLLESEINDFCSLLDETNMQGIIDVVGAYPEVLTKECKIVSEMTELPFLVDGLNDDSRIPAMKQLKEIGLLDRAILNSIDENTSEVSLEQLKATGVKYAVVLAFGAKAMFPKQKLDLLRNSLIPKAQKANIQNLIVDAAVLDLPSIGISFETVKLVKGELGLPAGYAPANAIYGWNFVKKYGDSPRCGAIASLMTNCVDAGSDFVLFGPIKYAKCVVPAIAMISATKSYYRKRVLRKNVSEKNPLSRIF